MMSKNSFLVSLKENNKRRIWLWVVSGLLWFCYYPVGMAMLMSRKAEHNHMDGLVGAAAKQRLTEAAGNWLALNNYMTAALVICAAIVCAIQGFSYLYSRKKVDLYHSLPVKKSRRFAVIYTNGVLAFFIPYLVSLLLALLIAWLSGGMDGHNLYMAAVSVPLHLILYAGIYGFAVLAVMMTGNLVITVFATLIFLLYEVIVRMLLEGYMIKFYSYFSYYSASEELYLSPVWYFGRAAEAVEKLGGETGSSLLMLLGGIFLAAAVSGIAYFCYLKRPAEAAGKAMAFERSKAVIKIFLTIPFALGVAYIVDEIVLASPVLVIFSMILAVILGNCLIEVIYEADIKAAFRKKRHILISGVCAAAIASVFYFDLTGYDAWEPSPEKLEDAVFLFSRGTMLYVDEDMETVDLEEYALGKPGVTDIEAICELTAKRTEEADSLIWMDVAYRMKNGKVVWRSFPVSTEEEELLNRVMGSEEYKKMAYQHYDDNDYAYIRKEKVKEVTFDNGFRVINLNPEDVDTIRELWEKDMENADYTTVRDEFKCGVIEVRTEARWKRNSLNSYYCSYDVYPSFTNLRKYLEEKEIDTDAYAKAEDIASITVTNYHTEVEMELRRHMQEEYGDSAISMSIQDVAVTKTFTEEDKIEELLEAVYPSNLSRQWKTLGTLSDEYYVTINYKDGRADSSVYRGYSDAHLITDRIPGWLEAETAYK